MMRSIFRLKGRKPLWNTSNDLYNQDCAWAGKSPRHTSIFPALRLFYSGTSRDILLQEKENRTGGSQDDWELIAYPSDQYRPVVWVDGYSYALLGADEDQALAGWLFLRYLLETENQAALVEATGALPLSNSVISALADYRTDHPAWEQALENLAMAQPVPAISSWPAAQAVSSDLAWQLKFLASKESIPGLLSEAQTILQEDN
jgi:ABC-type glycerol-3-phosphate transport system substrate-binding protein